MSCREDAEKSWYAREHRIIEEIKLIWATRNEALETYGAMLGIDKHIRSEVRNLTEKLMFGTKLFKLASGADEQEAAEEDKRLPEINDGFREIAIKVSDFVDKLRGEWERLKKEGEYWRKFLFEERQSLDELRRMKVEDRKRLLRKNATCLSLFISAKQLFGRLKDEWDDMKYDLDQEARGYMKELVVIAKEPEEL